MADLQPIILIKKKGYHGGHHGGAWKVAYADFVTAMMALFIVLWLLSSTSKQTQEQIAGYFNDPKGTSTKKGSEGKPSTKAQAQARQSLNLEVLKQQLLRAIQDVNLLKKLRRQIEITVTEEGLRVDLIEDKNGTFFELGSAKPTPALQEILRVISAELKEAPNGIFIEGHTDAQPYAAHSGYDNWDLSSDRANEARREMRADGIHASQVVEVRGFADQHLRLPDKPADPANRRVSIVVQPLMLEVMAAGNRYSQTVATNRPGHAADHTTPAPSGEVVTPEPDAAKRQTKAGELKSSSEPPFKEEHSTAPPRAVVRPSPTIFQRIKSLLRA